MQKQAKCKMVQMTSFNGNNQTAIRFVNDVCAICHMKGKAVSVVYYINHVVYYVMQWWYPLV